MPRRWNGRACWVAGALGSASPALAPLAERARAELDADAGHARRSRSRGPPPEALERVRRHPYVRLGLNGSFTSLWAGQLISLFGDRIHQLALAAAVLITTGSALASALVFVAATIPNLLFSPIAGTLVDRWDHKEVLVVSDLLRAAVVLLIPIAIVTNILFVYPLVFALTTISIFFRPARVAILPQIVRPDELLTANSALWVGETLADVIGYPLAGLFVVALGSALPIAFWLDAATYVASAVLLSTLVVRAADRRRAKRSTPDVGAELAGAAASTVRSRCRRAASSMTSTPGFLGELKAGWRFLRGEPVLLANTIQATVAQLTVGVLLALTPVYAEQVFGGGQPGWQAVYAFIETGVGAGNLIGGFLIGLVGMRFAKGQMVIAGYTFFGLRDHVPGAEREPRAGDRVRVRVGHREHALRHPEPDPVPGTDAARADGPRRGLPVRAGVRGDDAGDGARGHAGRGGRRGRGPGGLRAGHDGDGPGRPVRAGGPGRVMPRTDRWLTRWRDAAGADLGTLAPAPRRRLRDTRRAPGVTTNG